MERRTPKSERDSRSFLIAMPAAHPRQPRFPLRYHKDNTRGRYVRCRLAVRNYRGKDR